MVEEVDGVMVLVLLTVESDFLCYLVTILMAVLFRLF